MPAKGDKNGKRQTCDRQIKVYPLLLLPRAVSEKHGCDKAADYEQAHGKAFEMMIEGRHSQTNV